MIVTKARACEGKVRHERKVGALGHLVDLVRAGASYRRLQAYKCKSCGGWHVGHRPKPRRRR